MKRKRITLDEKLMRIALIENELTQKELAQLSGFSNGYICQIISGRKVSPENAQRIAQALGKSVSDLSLSA
jgi:transcriptional regulator with XRE-family HTH domain